MADFPLIRQFMRSGDGLLPAVREPELVVGEMVIKLPGVRSVTTVNGVNDVQTVTVTFIARYEQIDLPEPQKAEGA
jgi:hypothetical protein